jgi:tetratricopeptide (TPR) repeat protein
MSHAPFALEARADDASEAKLAGTLRELTAASRGGMKGRALALANEYRDKCVSLFGSQHVRYASALNALGFVHKNRGEVALAVDAYGEALGLLHGEGGSGRGSLAWAAVASNMGACFRAMADGARTDWERMLLLENALVYLSEALQIRSSQLPPSDPCVGETLSLIGGSLRAVSLSEAGRLPLAERYARQAVASLDSSLKGKASPHTALLLATANANLAVLLLQPLPRDAEEEGLEAAELYRAHEAEGRLRDVVATRRKHLGKGHPDTIEALLMLSQALDKGGTPSSAAEATSLRASADTLFKAFQERQLLDSQSDRG